MAGLFSYRRFTMTDDYRKLTNDQLASQGRSETLIGTVFGALVLLTGLVLSWFAIKAYLVGREVTSWPTAEATVIASGVKQQQGVARRGRPVDVYVPDLRYTYQVDGAEYTGSKVRRAEPRPLQDRDAVQQIADRYKLGSTVTAYVNPDDANEAVLEAGMADDGYFLAIMGPLGLAFGLFCVWAMRGSGKRKRAALEQRRAAGVEITDESLAAAE